MTKSFEATHSKPQVIRKALRQGLAGAALAATAALTPGITPAQAEKGTIEKLRSYIPTRVLEKQANQRLRKQQDLGALNGVLLFESDYNNGGSEYSPLTSGGNTYPSGNTTVEGKAIEHPVVVFRGNPKNEFGRNDLTNYAFGEINRSTGAIKLIPFDPATMELVFWSMESGPLVKNFIFSRDKAGHFNFNEPLTSSDNRTRLHGGPLSDTSGQPWQVGLEVSPKG